MAVSSLPFFSSFFSLVLLAAAAFHWCSGVDAISLIHCNPADPSYSPWNQTVCTRVDVGSLVLSLNDTLQIDLSHLSFSIDAASASTITKVGNQTCNDDGKKVYVNTTQYVASIRASASFNESAVSSSSPSTSAHTSPGSADVGNVTLTFVFGDLSVYNATTLQPVCSAHRSSLQGITVTLAWQGHVYEADQPLRPSWYFATGQSFMCAGAAFTIRNPHKDPAGDLVLVLSSVQAQAFMPNTTSFGPADADSYCPVSSTTTTTTAPQASQDSGVGLVVGAIIAGLAGMGILLFVYCKCRSRPGYEPLYTAGSH